MSTRPPHNGLPGPQLRVDTAAIAHNVRTLRARTGTDLMAVVKADGFGFGARTVARVALAHGATRLGVTSLGEARGLLDLGAPVLSWLNAPDAPFHDPALAHVEVAVTGPALLSSVLRGVAATGRTRRVHLFVDTGMGRDGCPPEEWRALCRSARHAEAAGLVEVVGVMGHLGCWEPDDPCHRSAVRRFAHALACARERGLRPRFAHLAATAAALAAPLAHHNLVRTGAGVVGIDPTHGDLLRPVAQLVAPIVATRRLRAGTCVGYGHAHRLSHDTHVGLVPLGYADGLPRAASGRAEVLVAGHRCRVLGLLSMDQLVIDLGDLPVPVATEVTVFGNGLDAAPTLAEWAGWSATLQHEIVTGIGARVPRVPVPRVPVPRAVVPDDARSLRSVA